MDYLELEDSKTHTQPLGDSPGIYDHREKKNQMTATVWDLAFFFLSLLPSFPQLFATESQQNRPSEHFVLTSEQTP